MASDRTEKPTPKRLREGRREGRIARTPELGGWLSILVFGQLTAVVGRSLSDRVARLLVQVSTVVAHPEPAAALRMLRQGLTDAAVALSPVLAAVVVIAVASSAAQGGLHLATKAAAPKLSRLNPLAGFKRVFGTHGLWEGAKALSKTVLVGLVVYGSVHSAVEGLVAGAGASLGESAARIAASALGLVRNAALAGLAMAAVDYGVQRRRITKQLKMSRQDVKDEMKQTEGDPHLRGAIRRRQMALGRTRMIAKVAAADVVLVNPTHVAVALRYEPDRGAPRVVAKGAGAVAAKIREEADRHRVPTVQDVPLARALHRACEVDDPIPTELFTAVARVLAFVMALKARQPGLTPYRPSPPSPPEPVRVPA